MISNLSGLLVERAATRPDLAIGAIDDQMDLGSALEIAAAGAELLAQSGMGSTHRAALIASNSTDYLLNWMSLVLAGVPIALIDPRYPPELLDRIVADLDPALIVTDLENAVGLWPHRRVVPSKAIRAVSVAGLSDPASLAGLSAAPHSVASIMLTSGTTGKPKYCVQSHEYFLRLGREVASSLKLGDTDRVFAPLPLFHVNPLGYGIIGALTAGADALTASRFSASKFWDQVREHSATALILHIPPTEILKRTTTAADAAGHDVKVVFCSDGDFMRQFGIATSVTAYGSTEAAGISSFKLWPDADGTPAESMRYGGFPRSDIELRLSDSGEIFVRELESNTLFSGYLVDGKVDSARDSDGWFATGDIGRLDADGGVVFVDRASESIRVGGEYVPVSYVEEQFAAVDGVLDVALWKGAPVPDLLGDNVVLYVVAEPVPVLSLVEVVERLPRFMRPKSIIQVDQIPRDTAVGKAQRRRLKDQVVRRSFSL